MPAYTMDQIKVKPVREIRMSKQGALLAAGQPRYETLQEYVDQFASPMSQLTGAGLYTFDDPLSELTLVVETDTIEWCGRCDQSLDDCQCPF